MSLSRTLGRKLTWLSVAWLATTMSLVTWWWIHAVLRAGEDERVRRMFVWEGSFLLAVLFAGGAVLVYLTHHHQLRHERLKMFFATFAHDLKTSMTRLRLQAELLEERGAARDPKVFAILKDIQRLDFQLENSLWMAQIESGPLLIQTTRLRDMMDHLRNEFADLQFEMSSDVELRVDRRAFTVVLRNLFHNSLIHGRAEKIDIQAKNGADGSVILEIGDNGRGLLTPVEGLGREILSSSSSGGTGLGLYLSRRLLERMEGRLDLRGEGRFVNVISLKGRIA